MKNEAPQLPHGPLSDRPFRILVVDDDSEAAGVVVAALEHLGYTAVRCAHAQEALRVIPSEKFDLLLIDYRMPDMTGLDLVTALRQDQCKTPVIMMTGHAATENRVPTEGLGVHAILRKPISLPQLSRALEEPLMASTQNSRD